MRHKSYIIVFAKHKQPKSMRHNNIIELTASRIATNNQLEVFLKVKQASNTDFSFLNPSDDLHRYYLYLKDKHTPNKAKDEEGDGSDDASGLVGLLGGYASSSDSDLSCSPEKKKDTSSSLDDGKKDTVDTEHHTVTETTDAKPASSSDSLPSEQDRKRKADRLERLRVWKESKLKEQPDG